MFTQGACDGLDLGIITDNGSGTVRLDQAKRIWQETSLVVGTTQGAHLPFRQWCREAKCLAITG